MKTRFSTLAISTLLTVSFLHAGQLRALAVDGEGEFYALGAGHRSCADYVAFREKRLENFTPEQYEVADVIFEHWIAGYMSAHNFYVADTYDVVGGRTMDDLKRGIETYCRANPNDRVVEGVTALVRELHPNRVKNGTPTGEQSRAQP